MNISRIIAAVIAMTLTTLSYSTSAQMRPECGEDPSKPGACFFAAEVGGTLFFCPDGVVVFGPDPDAKKKTGRVNPNGTVALHRKSELLPAGVCRTEDFSICGTTSNPGPGVYIGEASLQENGFFNAETRQPSCPFKVTVKGVGFRDVGLGPEEVQIDAVLQFVKDPSSQNGCRIQECRIFSD